MTIEHEQTAGEGTDHDGPEADPPDAVHAPTTVVPLRRRKEFWFWFGAVVVALIIGASFVIPLPYFIEGPGTVRPTQPRIAVEGLESFDEDGDISFTTVSQSSATPALILRAWLDDSIDIIEKKRALGDRTTEQDRAINQQLMDDSKVVALVVAFRAVGLEASFSGDGAFIEETSEGLPADGVLRPGEVIVTLDGQPVRAAGDLSAILADRPAGTTVTVTVRAGLDEPAERSVDLVLGSQPENPERGFLGVLVSTANLRADLPAEVELDSGSVIGPSAGLAWTLGVIDRITPGRLDSGRRVVVTGTMDVDGNVGPIGGLPQKTKAARNSDADVLLYPESTDPADIARMKQIAGDELETYAVATIDDALEVLAPDGVPQLTTAS